MNFQKKDNSFTKVSLISIVVAMIMFVGLSTSAIALDPVQIKVVDSSDPGDTTIVAAPDSDVNIYVRLDNVEFYTDPGIQAIQFVFTYPSDVLEIEYTTDPETGQNIPAVTAFDVTAGDGVNLLPWPVYAGFVDNTPGNPIQIGLAMNPVDAGWEDWDPGWYDADPPGDPPDFPIPPGEWPVNPEEIVYLLTSGKIVDISAHVKADAEPGDYPDSLVIDEILQEEIPPEEAIVPLAILNEYGEFQIDYDKVPGTLRVREECEVVISNVEATNITTDSATISWDTNIETDENYVEYGTDPQNLTRVDGPSGGTHHEVELTDLECETTYYYKVTSDCATDDNNGDLYQFTTLTVVISNVEAINITDDSATISWDTNIETDENYVEYGTDPQNLTRVDGPSGGTHHEVELTDLECDTTYYYKVTSDCATDDNNGDLYQFTTLTVVISNVEATNITDDSATISWDTNIETDENYVEYGTDPQNLTRVDGASGGTQHEVELTDLECDTTYYYKVTSDCATDDNNGDLYQFTTLLCCNVVITNVVAGCADNGVIISWDTEDSEGNPLETDYNVVYYGTDPPNLEDEVGATPGTHHEAILSDLPDGTYYYFVISDCAVDDNDGEFHQFAIPCVAFYLNPPNPSVSVGQDLTLEVKIDSGDVPVNGADVFLTYECEYLEIIDVDPDTPGIQPFEQGDFLPGDCPVLKNDTHDEPNEIPDCQLDYSQGCLPQQGDNSGEGVIASFTLRVLELPDGVDCVDTTIDFDFDLDNNRTTAYIETGVGGSKTPTTTGATIHICAVDSFVVQVPLESLEPSGDHSAKFVEIVICGDDVKELLTVETDPDGIATVEYTMPPGTYDIYAKEFHHLGGVVESVDLPIENPEENPVVFDTLLAGECDDTNAVNIGDFSWLALHFGQLAPEPPQKPIPEEFETTPWVADIDLSGAVNIGDFSWLSLNFGKVGVGCPVTAAPQLAYNSGSNTTAEFNLGVVNSKVGVGDEVEINVIAKNITDLYTYSFELEYNRNALKLLKSAEAPAREGDFLKKQTKRQSLFIARENADLLQRVIIAGSVTGKGPGATGNGTVASLRFRVISDAPGTVSLSKVTVLDNQFGRNFLPIQKVTLQAVPKRTAVLQNYPNPFNPETWIPYHLASDAEVSMKIYNLSGRLIRNLEIGMKPAGYHLSQNKAAYWNGRNESGEFVSSGIYFYTIQAGNFAATRKMVILK